MILVEGLANEYILNADRSVEDLLDIEWFETTKTIMRRATRGGLDVAIRKQNARALRDGDLLHVGDGFHVRVNILPCECIVVRPRDMREMGLICFEIGNLHIPLYIDDANQLCVAYEAPLYDLLDGAGYMLSIENMKLVKVNELRIVKGRIFKS